MIHVLDLMTLELSIQQQQWEVQTLLLIKLSDERRVVPGTNDTLCVFVPRDRTVDNPCGVVYQRVGSRRRGEKEPLVRQIAQRTRHETGQFR